MKNVPEVIYLQVGEDATDEDLFSEFNEVSWSSSRIFNTDIAFVLNKLGSRPEITEKQAIDRITLYQEAIDHLGMSVAHDESEQEQAKVVADEIQFLLDSFLRRYYGD